MVQQDSDQSRDSTLKIVEVALTHLLLVSALWYIIAFVVPLIALPYSRFLCGGGFPPTEFDLIVTVANFAQWQFPLLGLLTIVLLWLDVVAYRRLLLGQRLRLASFWALGITFILVALIALTGHCVATPGILERMHMTAAEEAQQLLHPIQ